VSGLQWVYILVIFVGAVLCSVEVPALAKRAWFRLGGGVSYALLNAVIWGVVYPFYSVPSVLLGAFLFSFILELVGLILSLLQTKWTHTSMTITVEELRKNIAGVIVVGIAGGLGSVFANLGYATGHVAIVSSVTGAVPLIAVLYGRYVYKEQLSKIQLVAVFFDDRGGHISCWK